MTSRTLATGLLLLLVQSMGTALGNAGQPREMLEAARIEPRTGHVLPLDASFYDHQGNVVVLRDLFGKRPVILCLVYFDCPMLCKLSADGLVRSVASLPETVGQDFDIAMISFDPRDTPERANAARDHALKNYAREGTETGWHCLTGTKASIDALTAAIGFHYVWDSTSKQFAHASGLTVVSSSGVIVEYLDGVQFSPRQLISAVRGAANNTLSERQPTSFVRCYLYDPTTGRFGTAVQWTIRGLGLLTVCTLGIVIFRLHHNERVQVINKGSG